MPGLGDLPRDQLVPVVLEYMMVGHLIDRALMPQVAVRAGVDAVDDVAIDEWLGASPTYTARMQRLMGIEGDDVGAIMKGLQLDVGFVHQYMGVSYELADPQHGAFWLNHCGALMDVEPHGEARVVGMCHHIEDPTFDGTAVATNPRARIRPIHRPPRIPSDREPHCHWTITIDPQNEPIDPTAHTLRVAQLPLASVPNERPPDRESGGKRDYRGPFDPAFRLADLSDGTLVAVAREFQEQVHLLTSSAELSLADRLDDERDLGLPAGRARPGRGGGAQRDVGRRLGPQRLGQQAALRQQGGAHGAEGQSRTSRKAAAAASTVRSICSGVWASDGNHASNCDGGG